MSKWDEPIKPEALMVIVFGGIMFVMMAVPLAFVTAAVLGLLGMGGTQDTLTILLSFAIVFVLGMCALIAAAYKVQ